MHRVGRTGRAGHTGVGITFVTADQARDVGKIAASLDLHEQYEGAGFARRWRGHPCAARLKMPRRSFRSAAT